MGVIYLDEYRYFRRRFYSVGVDLGQAHDPTAIAVVELETCDIHPHKLAAIRKTSNGPSVIAEWREELREHPAQYRVRHLERLPLGMAYPAQVAYVAELLRREPLASRKAQTYIDHTGVGRAVFDLFKQARVPRCHGVTITGGKEVTKTADGYHVAKLELISRLQALFHSEELSIEPTLADAGTLVRELQDFRVTFSTAGNAIFGAREGAHDDLVLAAALAVFGAGKGAPLVRADIPCIWN